MINWDQVRQLRDDVGAEDFGDVLELFLAEVDEAMEALPDIAPDDGAQLAPAMHFLKGSAYNLGFQNFGDYCSSGEAHALAGQTDKIELAKVQALYDQSKQDFFANAPAEAGFSGAP